jgi:hypothetical protein
MKARHVVCLLLLPAIFAVSPGEAQVKESEATGQDRPR